MLPRKNTAEVMPYATGLTGLLETKAQIASTSDAHAANPARTKLNRKGL